MTITVGTDSYLSVAAADIYWVTERGNSTWENADLIDKEKALREATQFLDARYEWIGEHPGSVTQELGWPRNDAVDSEGRVLTGIPFKVEEATAEAALLALSGRLLPTDSSAGEIRKQKVGSLEIEFFEGEPAHPSFAFIDGLLKGLTRNIGTSNKLVRV